MTKDELDVFLDEAAKCKFTRHCNCPYCSDPRAPLDGPQNFPIEFGYDNTIPNPHDPNGNLRMSEMIHIFDLYEMMHMKLEYSVIIIKVNKNWPNETSYVSLKLMLGI